MKFRPDIEGLRAIAVSLVVASHAGMQWFPGGFIGVDVFFVLSGYLITGLLIKELNTTGCIDFVRFYARRFRRLAPGLILMVSITTLLSMQILPVAEQIGQINAAASALLWVSNFYYTLFDLDYFGPGTESSLFLHTWSLGVEEQFYLIWPLLLILVLRFNGGTNELKSYRRLAIAFAAVFVFSVIACVLITPGYPMFAFYMMPIRAWQFALGALIWWMTSFEKSFPFRVMAILGWLGLGTIILAAIVFTPRMLYPGWRSVVPSLGTAAVIMSGVYGAGPARLLSIRPMLILGAVSYSWYLWHWPVLLLGAALPVEKTSSYQWILVAISLILAVSSYFLVERPIRRREYFIPRLWMMVSIAAATAASCFILGQIMQNQPIAANQSRFGSDAYLLPEPYQQKCVGEHLDATLKPCFFGDEQAVNTVVLMGDSTSAFWFPAVQRVFSRNGWRILVLAKKACPMVEEAFFLRDLGREFFECEQWRQKAVAYVQELHPTILILASSANYDFSESEWRGGVKRVLERLSPAAEHVYLMRSVPVLPFNALNCVNDQPSWLFKQLFGSYERCTASITAVENAPVYEIVRREAEAFININVIDMNDAICPDRMCRSEQDGHLIFMDEQHLTVSFVAGLSDLLKKRLNISKILHGIDP